MIDQTISALNDAVESAQEAQEAIENMSVSAETLAEGSSATVTKSEQEGVVHLEFGIPKGATGAQGERGEKGDKGDRGEQGIQGIQGERGLTGASGVYIGDTEPTDEGINVWIDTSEDTDDKSSSIVGIGRVGYMVVKSDTSADKSSPIVGVGQAGYMKI